MNVRVVAVAVENEGCSAEAKGGARKIRNDLLLIGAALLISVIAALLFFFTGETGEYASVIIDGEEAGRYSLAENREIVLEFDREDYYNLLVIKDGVAFVAEANCRDGICVSHRAIKRVGETIVCLPHRLVVEIVE